MTSTIIDPYTNAHKIQPSFSSHLEQPVKDQYSVEKKVIFKMDCNGLATQMLSLLLFLLFTVLIYIKRSHMHHHGDISCSQPKHPPSPSPLLPLIGHLHLLLLTSMPHHTLANLARRLGPIFHLQLGQVPTIVISSPKLARLVLKTYDHVFANRPQLIAARYLSFGCPDITFSSYGPYWRQARKICVTELLSSKRVGSFQLVREEEMARLLGVLRSLSGSEVDMSKIFFGLANDVLCRVAFGKRFITEGEKRERRANW